MTKPKLVWSFVLFLFDNYRKDHCSSSAAALSYTTLLSLVPLTAVVFSVFAAFPVFESVALEIQNFVFKNFVPASGEVVQTYLQQFAGKASQLTVIGIGALFVSALLLMNTIDSAMNAIWHIKTARSPLAKFVVYWAVLTLGPILMGISLVITSYLTSLPLFSDTAIISGLKSQLLAALPFLATTLACTLLYAVVPNTRINIRHALTGAVIAAVLFELAKKAFAFYITAFPTYEVIYGALAAIPVFLVWVYVSWLVILLGAEITYSLAHFHGTLTPSETPEGLKLLHNFRVIGHLWQSQHWGELLTPEQLVATDSFLDETTTVEALARLENAKLIHSDGNNHWALTKDMLTLNLGDLYHATAFTSPTLDTQSLGQDPWNDLLLKAVIHTAHQTDKALDLPLVTLYQGHEQHENDNPIICKLPISLDSDSGADDVQRIEPTFKL